MHSWTGQNELQLFSSLKWIHKSDSKWTKSGSQSFKCAHDTVVKSKLLMPNFRIYYYKWKSYLGHDCQLFVN